MTTMNNNQDSANNNRTPSFNTLVNCFRRINQAKSSDKKVYLQRYIEDWRKAGFGSFYPAMRLLVPHLDSERAYDLKETRLAHAYIRAFSLTKSSPDAQRLVNWTRPKFTGKKRGPVQPVGDFASIAAEVIIVRSVVTKSKGLSIDYVNENLRELSEASNFDESVKVIKGFLHNYTAEEQKWLIKIILKDLKIGLSEDSILAIYHPDARNVFNRCNNLQKVTDELTDPHRR
ncbi:6485_t:CDS:2, partial [Paraglomus occultum]